MTTPLVRSTRRAHFRLNSRKLSPMRVPPAQSVTVSATWRRAASRSRSRRSRVTRVRRVPNTNDSVRTWFVAARAWMNRRSSRDWRSIDPLMSHRTTIWRGRRVGRLQTQSRISPPFAMLRRNIARGATRRPWWWSSCRRVRRVSRPGCQQVDESFGVAQLGRGHPVELPVAQHLATRCRHPGAMTNALGLLVLVALVGAGRGMPSSRLMRLVALGRLDRPVPGLALLGLVRVGVAASSAAGGRSGAASGGARTGRTPCRTARVRRAGGRRRPRRPRGPVPVADVDERQRPGEVDRGPEVHVEPDGPQRPSEHDRLAEQPLRRRRRAAGVTGGRPGSTTRRDLLQVGRGRGAADAPDVLLVLEDDAEGLVDDGRRELAGAEGEQRGRPVERLGDARAPSSGRPRAGGGRTPTTWRGQLLRRLRAPGRGRSRAPARGSGSRSSGTGSGASARRGPRASGSR